MRPCQCGGDSGKTQSGKTQSGKTQSGKTQSGKTRTDTYLERGKMLQRGKRTQEARECFKTALQLSPESVDAQFSMGLLEQETGNWQAVLHHFRQVARLDPKQSVAYRLLGDALSRLGKWNEAVANYRLSIALQPNSADAHNNLGIALVNVGADHLAIAAFAKAVTQPNHANGYFNLGKLAGRLNELETAAGLFRKTVALDPGHAYAYLELGAVQERSGYLAEAAISYSQSMALDPTRTVRKNRASVLALMGDPRGITELEQLAREDPLDAEAHRDWGLGLLLHGRYEEGWREYEWRTEIPRLSSHHHRFQQPKWSGEALQGKTILLFAEQAHGDTLQFLRYIPLVVERGGRVVLEVQPLLKRLLQGLPGVAECNAYGETNPEFQTYASLMSLPWLLRAQAIPPPLVPASRPEKSARRDRKLSVGISWAGSAKYQRNRLRSIPLEQWRGLAQIEGATFTSLQMLPTSREDEIAKPEFQFAQHCTGLADFAELTGVLSGLDLIITVDTAVAHLAGAMGKAVWILLPNAVDWRWGWCGTSTVWYPTARLFRQITPADWRQTMAEVREHLQVEVKRWTPV